MAETTYQVNSTVQNTTQPTPITSSTIIVSNYRKRSDDKDPQKTLIEFFSFCGTIKSYTLTEEPGRKDYYTAHITFETPAAAQIALLLNTAVVGHEDGNIVVELSTVTDEPSDEVNNNIVVETSPPVTHTSVVSKLLSLGYKLKDGTLELAKQIDATLRVAAVTTIEATHVAQATVESLVTANSDKIQAYQDGLASVGSTVTTTGKVALDVTGEVLKTAGSTVATTSKVAYDITGEALKTVGSTVATTSKVAYDITGEALKTAGSTVATTSKVAYDITGEALKTAGSAVATTSKVALDVTGEALKTAGSAVATTSKVAYDITGHSIQSATDTTVEATQVATATVSSLYTVSRENFTEVSQVAQATVASLVTAGGDVVSNTGSVLKTAGAAVATTGRVALDVTGATLKAASNVALEATQIAGATISSVITAGIEGWTHAQQSECTEKKV